MMLPIYKISEVQDLPPENHILIYDYDVEANYVCYTERDKGKFIVYTLDGKQLEYEEYTNTYETVLLKQGIYVVMNIENV